MISHLLVWNIKSPYEAQMVGEELTKNNWTNDIKNRYELANRNGTFSLAMQPITEFREYCTRETRDTGSVFSKSTGGNQFISIGTMAAFESIKLQVGSILSSDPAILTQPSLPGGLDVVNELIRAGWRQRTIIGKDYHIVFNLFQKTFIDPNTLTVPGIMDMPKDILDLDDLQQRLDEARQMQERLYGTPQRPPAGPYDPDGWIETMTTVPGTPSQFFMSSLGTPMNEKIKTPTRQQEEKPRVLRRKLNFGK